MKILALCSVWSLCFWLASGAFDCPNGWAYHGLSCYFLYKTPSTWLDGRALCQAAGGHLVEISTDFENSFLANYLRDHGVAAAWIGLEDLVVEGEYMWTTSQEATEYIHWNTGEPNNGGGKENCVMLIDTGFWNDGFCDSSSSTVHLFGSLCEIEARRGSIVG